MPKKKKFPKGQSIPANIFFSSRTTDGYSSDDEQDDTPAWLAERDRQKAASKAAEMRNQQRVQAAVLLGEEHDFRTTLSALEKGSRNKLEEHCNEARIEREWIEFTIAKREQEAAAKKAPFNALHVQQMLGRANIADKETENRVSFFSKFAASANAAKEAEKKRLAQEKLESDRKKAAERAKAYEDRMRKTTSAEKPSLFQMVDAPAAEPEKAPEKKGGWWPW